MRVCVCVCACMFVCLCVCLFFNVILFSDVSYFYGRVVQTISTQFNQHSTWRHAYDACLSPRSRSCTFPHCTATAIANSSRNKCTRMKLATKKSCRLVERANWIPTEFQTGTHEYHHYYYYFMCIRNAGGRRPLSVCDWPDNLFKLKTRAHFTFSQIYRTFDDETLEKLRHCLIGEMPNTYTMTKKCAENLVNHRAFHMPAGIFRPPIGKD